jgi:chaperonin GroES
MGTRINLNYNLIQKVKRPEQGATQMAKKTPKIRPLGEKVLIKRADAEEVTRGGIVLPDSAREKPRRGTILAIGDGKVLDDGTRAEFQVKKDDVVLFSSYGGTEIKVDGEEYMLMDESDILAILS